MIRINPKKTASRVWLFAPAMLLLLAGCSPPSASDDGANDVGEPRPTTAETVAEDEGGLPSVPPPFITSEARAILDAMSTHLQSARSLQFEAEVTYDLLGGDGQLIEYGTEVAAAWKPGRSMRVVVDGDERKLRLYIEDGAITFADDAVGIFAQEQGPADLDGALDDVMNRLEIDVPLSDLLYSDPAAVLLENAYWGRRVGLHKVRGVACHHLAFVADGIDWQIWIDAGDTPLPRKLVIDYRDLIGSPSYSATLTRWQLDPPLPDDYAVFAPRDGQTKVSFLMDDDDGEEIQ